MSDQASRLLILDDDALIGETMQVMVQKGGYETEYTDDPERFFELLESWQPDFVAIDLIMPQKDGVEVIARMAEQRSPAKIIISSGADHRVLDAAKRSASEHGLSIIGVLSKPYTRQTLLDLLDNNCDKFRRSPTNKSQGPVTDIAAADLQAALDRGELSIVVQPKVYCIDETLAGFEVLSRWEHPQKGFVRPDVFIDLAEREGLIDELTEQVMNKALEWLAKLPQDIQDQPGLEGLGTKLRNISLSINISARSLGNIELFDKISKTCRRLEIDPARVILELTETSAMEDPLTSLDTLTRLRVKGFKLSIDDFGTGYSSMKQLVRLPFSEIKVDRSFVMSASESQESRSITHSIIELGNSLNLTTAAEGIEDRESLQFLREEGCDLAQGFFISRPLALGDVEDWILSQAWQCEGRRLAELRDLDLLDTPSEERFERHCRLARRMFDVPFAVISLVSKNRQWFKSGEGLNLRETARNISFCTHTIVDDRLFEIEDAQAHQIFQQSPLVTEEPHVRYYAGIPLRGPKGHLVGAFCLMDSKPGKMSPRQLEQFKAVAELVERELAEGQRGFIDNLTGVLNSTGYDSTARQAVNLARRLNLPSLSLALSLDNLTQINEDFGYDEGNAALCELARILQSVLRRSDLIGRYSGSTFRALLIDNNDSKGHEVIQRLRDEIHLFNARSDIYTLQCDIRPVSGVLETYARGICDVVGLDGEPLDLAMAGV